MGNSVTALASGPSRIKFNDDGTLIQFNLPTLRLNGMMWGKRTLEWTEAMNFKDEKNNLTCVVKFYKNESLLGKNEHSSDYFE